MWPATPQTRFRDRRAAGEALAGALAEYAGRPDALVLGLPRGGVVVAAEVARLLRAPLDALVVRKLGHPQRPELAVGAIAAAGVKVITADLAAYGVSERELSRVIARERQELFRREQLYRAGRPPLALSGIAALLIDDGLATGATMMAAVLAAWALGAADVAVGVPVAYGPGLAALSQPPYHAKAFASLAVPDLMSISQYYVEFGQTSDAEVLALLGAATGTGPQERQTR